jgi:hypothetical protein
MTDLSLTQPEADALIAMEKHREDESTHNYPEPGGSISIPLVSADKRERFFLDVGRGRIDLSKVTYQNRARRVIVLARLDLGGPSHRNPDGTEVPCPHLHLYREGYGDRWATPAPSDRFRDTANAFRALEDFMRFCNVTWPPVIQGGLVA